MQGRRSAGIKDIGVNVTMAAIVWDRKGARLAALRMARGIQKERKKIITRRDGQLPRTRSPNRFSEYVAGSRCMRIFKIVCYIRELLTIRFASSSNPRAQPPFSIRSRALSNLRQPSLPRTHGRIRERSPEVFIYMDRGVARAYLLSSVAVMARPPPPYLVR